ncbi:MAG: tubulin-like doman-containing protein [Candidatus Omnitrophica bacterium]|nr:tubulin-like doman-containing protein [Candidatus Omnitrophota bacterium]
MSIFLIGLGGFGKWVVTAFKNRLLERYGKVENIPSEFRYIAFDLVATETPNPQFHRFGFGRCVIDTLDYTSYSKDFHLFSGDYKHEMEKIRNDSPDKNPFISKFVSKEDAELYITDILRRNIAAGERRLTSRTVFFLDSEKIYNKLNSFLRDECLCFIVSSIAGGTGCGSLLDFLILLQRVARERRFGKVYRIPILFLPHGFKKAKAGEDLNFLEANCYAFFREFQRIDLKETQINISYSHSLSNVKKSAQEVLVDLPFIIDGDKIGGKKGENIPFYEGAVQSIVDFIESFWYTEEYETNVTAQGTRLPSTYENIIQQYMANNRNLAKENPQDALIYHTFGTFKWIFDSELLKREFAQQIAIDILNQYLEPPDINPQEVAQGFLKERATDFANKIVYELVNKGIGQMRGFATETNLESILKPKTPYEIREEGELVQREFPTFPQFLFDTAIRLTGNVANAYGQLKTYEERVMGDPNRSYTLADLIAGRQANTYHAVLNFYKEYYVREFKKLLQEELLKILHRNKNEPNYGKSSLKNALVFLQELKRYYDRFLGNEKEKIESEFEKAKGNASFGSNYGDEVSRFVTQHQRERYSFIILGDLRKQLREKYKLWNIQKRRSLLWDAIKEIAEENLKDVEFLISQIQIWIGTFEAGKDWIEKNALPDIRLVRNEKRNVHCHQYLTAPGDKWEYEMYEIIRGRRELGKEEKATNPVFAKLPQPPWKDMVKCFSWSFNLRAGENEPLPDPRRPESGLLCLVNKESEVKMPDWPFKDEFSKEDRESILSWNNQLTEYYITFGSLREIDKISVMDIFFWQGKTPREIKDDIIKNTSLMLDYDDSIHRDIENRFEKGGSGLLRRREKKMVLRGFLESDLSIKEYNQYIEDVINDLKVLNYLIIPGERNELLVSHFGHFLTATAMPNITKTKQRYLDIMNGYLKSKVLTPHVFHAEKVAFYYESKIAEKYKTPHQFSSGRRDLSEGIPVCKSLWTNKNRVL